EEQRAAVERALELGVNYFDTAGDYGHGAGETNLGRILKELRASPMVAAKIEVWPDDLSDIAGAVVRRTEESLRRLQLEQVEAILVHNEPVAVPQPYSTGWNPLSVEQFTGPGGAIDGLERLRASGKAKLIGFTCARGEPDAMRQVLDARKVDVINVWFNLMNPTAGYKSDGLSVPRDFGQIMDHAAKLNVGVAVFRPLAGGALTGQATGAEQRHRLAGGLNAREPGPYLADVRRA